MPAKPKIDYFDERTGYWTSFEIDDQRIVFRKSRPNTHWFVSLVSALILITIVLGLLQNPFGIITLVFLVYLVVTNRRDTRHADRKRFPIVIAHDPQAANDEFQFGRIFSKRNVRKFIVRENKNREGDDSHLVQIYMQLKDSDYLILLYQDYWTSATEQQSQQTAKKLRDWLSSPVHPNGEAEAGDNGSLK